MENQYKHLDFIGYDIESAVDNLLKAKEKGELISTDFNGYTLYSDTVTLDGAYKEITGKTKAEFDKAQQEWRDEYNRKEEEYKSKIPELSREWMEKGREVLKPEKWALWDKIVPIRIDDLYHGMELGASLDIIKELNSDGTAEETLIKAKRKIESQNHSEMSWGLVCSMVREFSARGQEFCDFVR